MDVPCLIFPFITWWTFDCFHFLATIYIHLQVVSWTYISFLLCPYLGVELLYSMVTLQLIWGTARLFSKVAVPPYVPTSKIPVSPHPHGHLLSCFVLFCCVVMPILADVQWHFPVVSICVSLVAKDVVHLFHDFIGHLYIFFGEIHILFKYKLFHNHTDVKVK